MKWMQTRKEEVKLPVLVDDMLLYLEDSVDCSRTVAGQINNICKGVGFFLCVCFCERLFQKIWIH